MEDNNGHTSPSPEFSFTTSLYCSPPPITPPLTPLRTKICTTNNSSTRNSLTTVNISLDETSMPCLERVESDLGQRYNMRSSTSRQSQENYSKPKMKSFSSIFRLGNRENKSEEPERIGKKKKKLDLGQVWRKYITMMESFFFYNKGERERRELRRRPHSFSGNTNLREMEKWRRRKLGQQSAPASMRTSPANSGHFTGNYVNKLSSSSDESTMEELQNAIQAAIAHCKSSISAKAEM